MRPLVATYRLQFTPNFTFADASEVMGYLKRFGVSHVYSSPVFKSRKGSCHGYDVTDHNGINPELGNEEEFRRLLDLASSLGMGWIQGIVPNHMAYSSENAWLMDVLELGALSKHLRVFDIDWEHHSEALKGRVLAPFLERSLEESLLNGAVKLGFDDGFKFIFGQQFPVRLESYPLILASRQLFLSQISKEDPRILGLIRLFQGRGAIGGSRLHELKALCSRLHSSSPAFRGYVEGVLDLYNSDSRLLGSLALSQNYLLAGWREAYREINYRRFFNINDLICIRAEDKAVFDMSHRLVLGLVRDGKIDGLRVDHVDGLKDPLAYLRRLKRHSGKSHIFVEKILLQGERLPGGWPVDGTTGYEILNQINGVFMDGQNSVKFDEIYRNFTGLQGSFGEVLADCKGAVLSRLFSGDVDSLAHAFKSVLPASPQMSVDRMREAVAAILSSFQVYRSYMSPEAGAEDRAVVAGAIEVAMRGHPSLAKELGAIRDLLEVADESEPALDCLMRLQQYSGPIMAKGLEDTAFYRYNRFISANEVGNVPGFGVPLEEFHGFNIQRAERWPRAMSATSTHDTKRGEDARARLNVLSEMPKEWEARVARWRRMNRPKKVPLGGGAAPTKNEEYYIYQALIASFPFKQGELNEFRERFKAHMIKATREAKENSSWLCPSPNHESAILSFVDRILDPEEGSGFFIDFTEFQGTIARYGIYNSLSQTLLKVACPGVPDFYQGSEFWDFNMVDPDNRRPVDYRRRVATLEDVKKLKKKRLSKLLESPQDGLVKLLVTSRSLEARGKRPRLFTEGKYLPLETEGMFRENIVAFARELGGEWAVAAVPRFLTRVVGCEQKPLGPSAWGDTRIVLPPKAPSAWVDAISREWVRVNGQEERKTLDLGALFKRMPIALLTSWNHSKCEWISKDAIPVGSTPSETSCLS